MLAKTASVEAFIGEIGESKYYKEREKEMYSELGLGHATWQFVHHQERELEQCL
jgi:hypothetical protein